MSTKTAAAVKKAPRVAPVPPPKPMDIDPHERLAIAAAMAAGLLAGPEAGLGFASDVVGINPEDWKPALHYPRFVANRAFAMTDALLIEAAKK